MLLQKGVFSFRNSVVSKVSMQWRTDENKAFCIRRLPQGVHANVLSFTQNDGAEEPAEGMGFRKMQPEKVIDGDEPAEARRSKRPACPWLLLFKTGYQSVSICLRSGSFPVFEPCIACCSRIGKRI